MPIKEKRIRFIELGWELLEHKCRYYIKCDPIIEDHIYDKMEKEYETLAKELNEPPSVTDMVDFNTARPACKLVMKKLNVISTIYRGK